MLRTEGTTAASARAAAPIALAITLAFVAAVSLWTPLSHSHIAQRWFSLANIAFLSPVPIVTALVALGIWRAINGAIVDRAVPVGLSRSRHQPVARCGAI